MLMNPARSFDTGDRRAPSRTTGIQVQPGTSAYRRISGAFFLTGFGTFSLIYCVQPLLPVFADSFRVSPSSASLALSLTTGFLALSILAAAPIADRFGRRGVIFGSMLLAAVLNIAAPLMPVWSAFLVARAAEGIALGGVPAVAMAYLAEEIAPEGLGASMGLYVAGTAFGGMVGRVGTGILTDEMGWRPALVILGIAAGAASLGFLLLAPSSQNFDRRPDFAPRYHASAWSEHLRHVAMPCLYAIGFLAMGAFVAVYNFADFRLSRAPFSLSQSALGAFFLVYLFGIGASWCAAILAKKMGRAPLLFLGLGTAVLGACLTLPDKLPMIILGIVVLTIGFFLTHSAASGWVGRIALRAKGHASSLYLLSYYLGSSVVGSTGGWFWHAAGWSALVGFVVVLLAVAGLAAWRLQRLTPGLERALSGRADFFAPSTKLALRCVKMSRRAPGESGPANGAADRRAIEGD